MGDAFGNFGKSWDQIAGNLNPNQNQRQQLPAMAMWPRQTTSFPEIGGALVNTQMQGWNSFAPQMSNAMGQINSVLSGNAQRQQQNRWEQDQKQIALAKLANERAAIEGRNNLANTLLTTFNGRQYQPQSGGGQVGYTAPPQDFVPQSAMQQQNAGPQSLNSAVQLRGAFDGRNGQFANGALAAQENAANSMYGSMLGPLSDAAFTGPKQTSGFDFQAGGQSLGSATVGGMPGMTAPGQPEASVNMPGIQATQFWGDPQRAALNDRLSRFSAATSPALAKGGNSSLAQAFQQYLSGATGKLAAGLDIPGTKSQATHDLASQVAQSDIQNKVWDMIARMYGGNLENDMSQRNLEIRALQGLV